MKRFLIALFASYALTSGQAPPAASTAPPGTTAAPGTTANNAGTTAAAAQTTAAAAPQTTLGPVQPQTTAAPIPVAPVITPAPVTPAPVTPAPTFYQNPYCPPGEAMNKIGSAALNYIPGYPTSQNAFCTATSGPASIARDYQGMLTCNDFHCCMCSEVNCGGSGFPCDTLKISSSGAVGVKNIAVIGSPSVGLWGVGGLRTGAEIACTGLEACKASTIRGQAVHQIKCAADFSCEGSYILLEPTDGFQGEFNGMMSAMNAVIEIVVTAQTMISSIQTLQFNGQQSAQGATVIIRNQASYQLLIENVECMNPTACVNTNWIMEGDIFIDSCDLDGAANLNNLPDPLKNCMFGNLGFVGGPGLNPYTPPQNFNPNPIPVNPNPVMPAPGVPGLPANPAPLPAGPVIPAVPAPQPAVPAPQPAVPAPVPATNNAPYTPLNAWQELKCADLLLCRGQNLVIVPADTFKLTCSLAHSCQGMTLTLNIGMDPLTYEPVQDIDVLKFSAEHAGTGATINIADTLGYGVQINDVRCEKVGACHGLTINLGPGVYINNFDCQAYGACQGCTVIQGGKSTQCAMLEYTGFGGAPGSQQQLPWVVY